jgi:hypothetical protein
MPPGGASWVIGMLAPEKIASAYLRLNGFFLMPYFTILLQPDCRHVDFLGVHVGSTEKIGPPQVELSLDRELFELLGTRTGEHFVVIAEVKGTEDASDAPLVSDEHFAYVKKMFTGMKIKRLGFEKTGSGIHEEQGHTIVSLSHCLSFIEFRFIEAKAIASQLECHHWTKTKAWSWHEEFLSDLLFLHNLGCFRRTPSLLRIGELRIDPSLSVIDVDQDCIVVRGILFGESGRTARQTLEGMKQEHKEFVACLSLGNVQVDDVSFDERTVGDEKLIEYKLLLSPAGR